MLYDDNDCNDGDDVGGIDATDVDCHEQIIFSWGK